MDDPGYWRFRAKNARELAETAKEENERAIILNVAEHVKRTFRFDVVTSAIAPFSPVAP